jgi:hypothetical protein
VGSGLAYNAASKTLSGTPSNADAVASPVRLSLTATDPRGGVGFTTLTLVITNVNDPPVPVLANVRPKTVLMGSVVPSIDAGRFFVDPGRYSFALSLRSIIALSMQTNIYSLLYSLFFLTQTGRLML